MKALFIVLAIVLAALVLWTRYFYTDGKNLDPAASQIERNGPSEDFHLILRRDLAKYFSADYPGAEIEYTMLRDAPTQSGVSFPKYYVWVKAGSGGATQAEGAVRLAAIDNDRFEVTDFVPRKRIIENPQILEQIFPPALVPKIKNLAGTE